MYIIIFTILVKYTTMKFEIAIENAQSLKLRQTRQVDASLLSTTPTQPTMNDGHTACQWAVRRGRSG